MLRARRLCRSRRETGFSPESMVSLEAKFNGSSFCDLRRAADRRWGFGLADVEG